MPLPTNLTPEEFYRHRDGRTRAAVRDMPEKTTVTLSMEEGEAKTQPGQAAFLLAANLTSRWCRTMRIVVPDIPLSAGIGSGVGGSLRQTALSIAQAADPFGSFEWARSPGPRSLKLHIGRRPPADAFPIVGRGWLALAGLEAVSAPDPADTWFSLGSLLATCVGVSWLFRKALDHTELPSRTRLSLWNLRGRRDALQGLPAEPPKLGRVLMVGAGAVGSGIAFFLPTIRALIEEIDIIDGDQVEISNLNRSPLFFADHVGLPKAVVTAEYLRDAGYSTWPTDSWFDEAVKQGAVLEKRHDLVIPVADEKGVRHAIQHHAPPLLIYGTTGADWNVFLGRHIPLKEDCLACRFPAPKTRPTLACGEGMLAERTERPSRSSNSGSLPFASAAAAILACAEIAKLARTEYPINPNFACLGFRGPLEDFLTAQERPVQSCLLCPNGAVWRRLNGKSRHANLSFAE